MKSSEDGWVHLGLVDVIRVNQLVRNRVDFAGFELWYQSLGVPEQSALIIALCEFAHQAGFDQTTYNEALAAANLDPDNPLVKQASPVHESPRYLDFLSFSKWVSQLGDIDRAVVFRKFVYLFGKAEDKVYRSEPVSSCNHWWHRNLLDERIVQALLSNPEFYRTSRKDDALLEQT